MFVTKTDFFDKKAVYMPGRYSHPGLILKELGFFKGINCNVTQISYDVGLSVNETSTKNIIQRYIVYPKKLLFQQ